MIDLDSSLVFYRHWCCVVDLKACSHSSYRAAAVVRSGLPALFLVGGSIDILSYRVMEANFVIFVFQYVLHPFSNALTYLDTNWHTLTLVCNCFTLIHHILSSKYPWCVLLMIIWPVHVLTHERAI